MAKTKKNMKKKAKKKTSARHRPSVKPKKKAPPPKRSPRGRAPVRAGKRTLGAPRAAFESVALESVDLEAAGGGDLVLLNSQLDVLGRMQDALRAQLGE